MDNKCAKVHMTATMRSLVSISRLFALLTDPLRLRILRLLRQGELCVCELVDALGGTPQYRVSRHLGALRKGKLVVARRRGRWMHYRLDGVAAEGRLAARLIELLDHELARMPETKADHTRLEDRLRLRRSGQCVVGNRPAARVAGDRGDGRAAATRQGAAGVSCSRK